ncbi:DUF4267 domain-containing protein [Streptomyces chryseus]|uniref:Membrane protein n=1 Tax=Streptomyces chryseus TaxID=68186 RepID=A0ABQ3DNE4_9ACTN|nr:DUF4267 domain-containing protein [Streptomyces chryseus]GGX25287.1 membrane protein [Streptomyces chryseus]GHB04999.1 membrane protein [Streptomyces chryseus]
MTKQRITTGLALVTGLAPLFFGLNFLLNPGAAPDGFGIEPWPTGNASGYFMVKGVRDVATATIVFILLARGQRRALGWVVLTTTVIPLGDALAVVTHGGTLATAMSVHVSAAALVALTAVLLLTESRSHHACEPSRPTTPSRPLASPPR